MRQFISLSIIAMMIGLAGCRSAPLEQVLSERLQAPPGTSLAQIRSGIIKAGLPGGWKMVDVEPGHLIGRMSSRGEYKATVDILYDTEIFSILYRDSRNLRFTGETINERYVLWVRALRASIQTEMRRLDAGAPPLVPIPPPTKDNPIIEAVKPPRVPAGVPPSYP